MNLFTRNSPYYHLLKYLIFLVKHPVYLHKTANKNKQFHCFTAVHLKENTTEGPVLSV